MNHTALPNRPSFVPYANRQFLIMDAPTDPNLHSYIEICKKYDVTTIVRACEPSYSTAKLADHGIQVVEMPFDDGEPPPISIVDKWLEVCDNVFCNVPENKKVTIAVHCVAGLGRAPVLVAISLIELGMDAVDAVQFIRSKRRGAINARQLQFLETYKPKSKADNCCILS